MDDPVQTHSFIKDIIDNRKDDIIGLAITKGDRLTISKDKSKLIYLLSLLLIMGVPYFIRNSFKTILFKIKRKLSKHGICYNPSILKYAEEKGIKTYNIKSPNNKNFRSELINLKPDIIINQSQSIIKQKLIDIPKIGVLNRHNALLPKNRGRLTPFWVLFKKEEETAVSIHFVEEGIDSGDIIVQKKFKVSKKDTFKSIVNKNYTLASKAMLESIDLLENGFTDFIPNNDNKATYNSTPSFKQALKYRINRLF